MSRADANNVIISFNHYLQANPKLYAVYMDAGLHFTSQKLHMYFKKKDIAVVFTPSTSHKSVGMIESQTTYYNKHLRKCVS